MLSAVFNQFGEFGISFNRVEGVHLLQMLQVCRNSFDFFCNLCAFDYCDLGFAVVEYVFVVGCRDCRINWHNYATELHYGHVDHVPFGLVAADERNLIARLYAVFEQAAADAVNQVVVFLWTIFFPFGVHFAC